MKAVFGNHELEFGGTYLSALVDSSDLLGRPEAMRERLKEDGYLLLRGFHDRTDVIAARMANLEIMKEKGKLGEGFPMEEGVCGPEDFSPGIDHFFSDYPEEVLHMTNSNKVMSFFSRLLGGEACNYRTKWLRAAGTGASTPPHYDIVYMGQGTPNVYTVWTPLGDIPVEMGGLAVCLGSQHFEQLIGTYGKTDFRRDGTDGVLCKDPIEVVEKYGGRWATTDYKAGDVLIFGMFMLHSSLVNQTNRYRVSMDTRYQLASEPIDIRWN